MDYDFARKVVNTWYSGQHTQAHAMVQNEFAAIRTPIDRSDLLRLRGGLFVYEHEYSKARSAYEEAFRAASGDSEAQAYCCIDLMAVAYRLGDLSLGTEIEKVWIALERFADINPELAGCRGRASITRGYLSLLRREYYAAASWFWAAVQFYTRPTTHPLEGPDRNTMLPASYCHHAYTMLLIGDHEAMGQDLTLAGDWVGPGFYAWNYYISLNAEYMMVVGNLGAAQKWLARAVDGGFSEGQWRVALATIRLAMLRADLDLARAHIVVAEQMFPAQYNGHMRRELEDLKRSLRS